jgi:transcriptional regulator with XRE-family HTH domain
MNFGIKVKQLRAEKKLSVRKLAAYAGLSKTTISEIENNIVTNPTRDTIERLAKALDIPAGLLLEENETLQNLSENLYGEAEFKGSLNNLSKDEKINMLKEIMVQEPKVFYEATPKKSYIGPLTPNEYAALSAYLDIYRKSKEE